MIHAETHDFINTYYSGIFDEIHFANHHLTQEEAKRLISKKKSQICAEIGAQILIDDSLSHAIDCASSGIKVLLFDHEG
jgi:hypothetical protein